MSRISETTEGSVIKISAFCRREVGEQALAMMGPVSRMREWISLKSCGGGITAAGAGAGFSVDVISYEVS